MSQSNPYPNTPVDHLPEVELRDARLAAFLAWLVPGLGHLYQGRTGKGLLFMITILGTFAYGMHLGDGRVVYASTTNPLANPRQFTERWHYACQLPVGLAALPAYVQQWRVESDSAPIDLFGDNFERPPYTRAQAKVFFPNKSEDELQSSYFQSKDQSKNLVYHATELQQWNHDLNYFFELGTVFTMVAGLMNILAICDARWGPLVALHPKENQPPPTD